jgi:hypothetical protein
MGQLLQLASYLEAIEIHQVQPGPVGLYAHFQDLSHDVCGYRDRYRQRARNLVWALGSLDG